MVGIVVSAIIVASQASDPGALEVSILAAGAFAGPAVAVSISTLLIAQRATADQVRYARSQAVELSDYVHGTERWLARGPAILAVLYFTVWGVGIWVGALQQAGLPALIKGAA